MTKAKIIGATLFPWLLVLYELPTYFSNDGYLPAVPNIMADLSASQHLVLLTITTWFIAPAALQLILGPISDRYGRRPVLLLGGLAFMGSSFVCAITSSITLLFVARFVQGATVASMTIAGYATLHELLDHKRAIHALAWMYSITLLGTALGPLFGALILKIASWRYIFIVVTVWAAVIIGILYFLMPETCTKKTAVTTREIIKNYLNILTNQKYLAATLSFCFLFAALIAWITVGPFFMIVKHHYSQFHFGIAQAFIFGSYIIGAQCVKHLMRKHETVYLSKVGLMISLLGGLSALVFLWVFPTSLLSLIIPMMLIIGATGFCAPILNRISIDASNEPMGARMAMFYSLVNGFGMLGSAAISAFYNGSAFSFTIILFVCTLFSFLLFARPSKLTSPCDAGTL